MIIKNTSVKIIGIGNVILAPDQSATISDSVANSEPIQCMKEMGVIDCYPEAKNEEMNEKSARRGTRKSPEGE